MAKALSSYIRTYRKRNSLTQDDLAALLGLKGGQAISRYERQQRTPNLRTALACQVLFDVPLHELFPGLYREAETLTIRRIGKFSKTLNAHSADPKVDAKRDLLLEAMARAEMRRERL